MKNNIWVTGDVHAVVDNLIWRIKSVDLRDGILLQVGDAGLIWDGSKKEKRRIEYLDAFLEARNVKLYFSDGNHENFDLLYEYPLQRRTEGITRVIGTNIYHVPRGVTLELEGQKILFVGGASSIDKYHRIEGLSWWKEEVSDYEEANQILDSLPKEVDYIITHTAPRSVVETFDKVFPEKCPQQELLEEVISKVNFKHLYFGHFHFQERVNDKFTCLYDDKPIKIGEN